jgi:hypothetical protein
MKVILNYLLLPIAVNIINKKFILYWYILLSVFDFTNEQFWLKLFHRL